MLDAILSQLIHYIHHPYALYGAVTVAAACLVFGIAAVFEPRMLVGLTARRTGSMHWAVTGISNKFVPENKKERDTLGAALLQAGYDTPNAVQVYYGLRILFAIGLPAVLLIVLPIYGMPQKYMLLACILAAIVGFLAPPYWVRVRRNARHRQFREGLPDVLDLLLVCSEAGLGIDMALMRVGDEMIESHPLLAKELQNISGELRAGLVRADAMRHFAKRTGIDETISLVNLLIHSDTLGTSMATTLRAFAEDMRSHRMLRAEELGHKAGAKLTVILVACFLPAMFAAMLAPATYSAVTKMHAISSSRSWH